VALSDLSDWLDEHTGAGCVWYVKRLSGNDTLANGTHQAGPYITKEFLLQVFPAINRTDIKNPDLRFDLYIDSHADHRQVRAVYYNNKFHENPNGGRNETRLTNFGGGASALLDPDSTGALTVFAFRLDDAGTATAAHVWVCRDGTEEDLIEERIGPVEPGRYLIWPLEFGGGTLPLFPPPSPSSCWIEPADIPLAWLAKFPNAAEIVRRAVDLRPLTGMTPDQRLLKRRECEFEIFRSVEQAVELPHILAGFAGVDAFIDRAQTILQRRKARSGRSLELHAREIFLEENLQEGTQFAHQPESEAGKRPDFLFPSRQAYADPAFPAVRLRMLAVKTTCRDRWRQILNEADRIPAKHLLTLQEGVSEAQFAEMTGAGVQLVIPQKLISAFPPSVQPHLQTLESFIGDVRMLGLS
jgi:hypothetical protein